MAPPPTLEGASRFGKGRKVNSTGLPNESLSFQNRDSPNYQGKFNPQYAKGSPHPSQK